MDLVDDPEQVSLIEGLPPGVKSLDHNSSQMLVLCNDCSVWSCQINLPIRGPLVGVLEMTRLDLDTPATDVAIGYMMMMVVLDEEGCLHFMRRSLANAYSKIPNIASFEMSNRYIIMLGRNGQVQTSGDDLLVIQKLPELKNIEQVSCGSNGSFLALASNGLVHSWGFNHQGQLGRYTTPFSKDYSETITNLPLVREILSYPVFSLFLTVDNQLFRTVTAGSSSASVTLVRTQVIPSQIHLKAIPLQPKIKSQASSY